MSYFGTYFAIVEGEKQEKRWRWTATSARTSVPWGERAQVQVAPDIRSEKKIEPRATVTSTNILASFG